MEVYSEGRTSACIVNVFDEGTGSDRQLRAVTIGIDAACDEGSYCFLRYLSNWTTWVSCVGGAPGEQCPVQHSAQDLFKSVDGGSSWTFYFQEVRLGPDKTCISTADPENVVVTYIDSSGTITPAEPPISTVGLPLSGNTGDPPSPTPPNCAVGPGMAR